MATRARCLTRMLTAVVVLGLLTACTNPGSREPDDSGASNPTTTPTSTTSTTTTDPPTEVSATDVSEAEVRATLGALDPCTLLSPSGTAGARRPYAEGPHTCKGQLDGTRVRVEVGVPFDEASREAAEPQEIAGLVAYDQADRCRVVFPAGMSHGIAVEAESGCRGVAEAGAIVGSALAADNDSRLRARGPDAHSACDLLTDAVADPTTLVDAAGDTPQGLDHCEVATGPALSRTGLSLGYTGVPFDEMARLVTGDRVSVAGQEAVLNPGEGVCHLHTYLWSTHADGRGEVRAEAVLSASSCEEAQTVAASVVTGAGRQPVAPGSVSDLLTLGG